MATTATAQRFVLLLVALMMSPVVLCGSGFDGRQDKTPAVKIVDKTKVYYPATIKKDAKFKTPATVVTATVFDAIPEWKKIEEKKLTTKDAEYHLLLKAANDKFQKALTAVQKDGSYDIVAESGAIECTNCEAVDVTQTLIDKLPADDS